MATTKKTENDRELCSKIRKFYPIYYQALDTERDRLMPLFVDNLPTLTWNGHRCEGKDAIRTFLEQLPKMDHTVACVNPQVMDVTGDEAWALVSVLGNVVIGGENHGFTQSFVMVPDAGTYRIQDHQYRFID
ncbi:NTF2 domain-containing protein [Aphelenchoides fujianensis]|nr:NTF2 domain-containing protein [Aphelenchoides fujianensis]